MSRNSIRVLVGITLTVLIGCSGSTKGQLPTYKATGTLQIDGKPFGPCTLTLEPVPLTAESRSTFTMVGSDGKFTSLRTYKPGDGIPEGEFVVKLAQDAMSATAVPGYKPKSIVVKKPDSGALKMQIDLESTGGPLDDLPRDNSAPPASI